MSWCREEPDLAAELVECLGRRRALADVRIASMMLGRLDLQFTGIARDMVAAVVIGESPGARPREARDTLCGTRDEAHTTDKISSDIVRRNSKV